MALQVTITGCMMILVSGSRVAHVGVQPTESEQHDELWQCSRQCRWKYGFFDRTITGKEGKEDEMCECYTGQGLELDPVRMYEHKRFDVATTWGGNSKTDGASAFSCPDVCVEVQDGGLKTMPLVTAQATGATILHCGWCAACSRRKDIEVIARTRDWITETMTSVSAAFAAPWGHKNPERLALDLVAVGFDVSRTPEGDVGRYDNASMPSCMDCWVDNIMCDSMTCTGQCWAKFLNPENSGGDIVGDPKWYEFNKKCLACDEANCGPEFIKCAGANRRSTGIISDIKRPDAQRCKVGLYSHTKPESLPNMQQPSKKFVKKILNVDPHEFPQEQVQVQLRQIAQDYNCCCHGVNCKWFHHSLATQGTKCPQVDDAHMCLRHCQKLFDSDCHQWKPWSDSKTTDFCTLDKASFWVGEECDAGPHVPLTVDQTLPKPTSRQGHRDISNLINGGIHGSYHQ
mmetsp:Transcript_126050/g.251650  ORF Transcript_126050/g.251650 Transcript_126050/m.251650 type:complete len:458 (+) Transcript_126050:59-1432(+)|eukprot:CAMPEP_0172667046 /NCGR_PEP_ID=MMETSP1074-20121228/8179_1 /TAXON_ID=2916 /ORGANISM="Ceratium fusus, Strain PA161109" /LENGTH=457 /DNA_ID=CAMNT_0013483505 /DNA_START=58 /DNA_END=1431 /DNA_ORIENTATION=-